ncbi:hypothetical protein A3A66_02300 [Microgenomates group bacterium RIFCSPLOWO2_01_FULL_46_13]|nr:MAG: hypothetical protein A2783_00610 [Microgenomates group bacterium RIFCSPHIGHO2_01_FULL_45_11]OGV94805.1 MAG: hypothetical protein A3A66_02300 [Microgenomates group bacterium RIFCSPLOWO2_01_FULL_46_13]
MVTPITVTTLYLAILYCLALIVNRPVPLWFELFRVSGLIAGFIIPHLIYSRVKHYPIRIENILITSLIILLIASRSTTLWGMVVIGLVTFLIKTGLRLKGLPLFNPAAAGLVLGAVVGVIPSWWGVSLAPRLPWFDISWLMFITLPVGIYLAVKYQKLPTVIGTSLGLIVSYLLLNRELPLRLLFEGTAAFFIFIMATEPKTTPVQDKDEWWYALSLGSLIPLLLKFEALPPYLTPLIIVNGLFALERLLLSFPSQKSKLGSIKLQLKPDLPRSGSQ